MEALLLAVFTIGAIALVFGGGKSSRKPPADFEPSETYRNFTQGYDPLRDVYWTREDKIEIGEF